MRSRRAPIIARWRVLHLIALGVVSAAFLIGLAILTNGAVRSAVLVDSLPTENTVATVELSAAWVAMLLGLVISVLSAAAGAALLLAARRQRARSTA